jgi:hypothetical protein
LKTKFLTTLTPTIFSQIKQDAVMNALREQRMLHEKKLKEKADEVSKRVFLGLS